MDRQTLQKILRDLDHMDASDGLDMGEMVYVTDDLRQLLGWMVRKNRFLAEELRTVFELSAAETEKLLNKLQRKGFVELVEKKQQTKYHVRVKSSRKYRVPKDVWKALED